MKRFNSILCVVDSQKCSHTAIAQSVMIANDHQAKLTVASVVEPAISWRTAFGDTKAYGKGLDELINNKKNEIAGWISSVAPTLKARVEIYTGIAFIKIIQSVVHNKHDLVIKCAEESDWLSRMFASEDMHLLRKCPCPVLMLKPGQNDRFQNILATVDVNDDFSEPDEERVQDQLNKQVLEYSATLCMPELTTLHIGSAWDAYAEDFYRYGAFSSLPEDEVNKYVDRVRRDCVDNLDLLVKEMNEILGKETVQYLHPQLHLVKGKPYKEIPLMAEKHDIDLIVMGTVGRIKIPGLIIGNTAESILEQVQCSVLAIKPKGFKTPVM